MRYKQSFSAAWGVLGILVLMLAWTCQPAQNKKDPNNRALARVHNKTLYLSDMEGMIPSETSSEDSAQIINAFVERWVRDAALMYEAERNVPKDLNIDKLVRDYRASLIRHSYEKILIEELLDSTVTAPQLEAYYEKNKDQFPLESDIARCRFIKMPRNTQDLKQFEEWWKSDKIEDFQMLVSYCNDHALAKILDDSLWYSLPDLGALWPGGAAELSNLQPGRKLTRRDENFLYYFQLNNLMRKKELSPIGYVDDQLKKVILHQRKMKLLDETRENIYQDALRRNQVNVFQN
ncbi:MAG: mechanosensitive ion channel family protein [Saprospirales bacterium]|nr:mechanosensitive ion channel family protein [Saprospirales bacterium]